MNDEHLKDKIMSLCKGSGKPTLTFALFLHEYFRTPNFTVDIFIGQRHWQISELWHWHPKHGYYGYLSYTGKRGASILFCLMFNRNYIIRLGNG